MGSNRESINNTAVYRRRHEENVKAQKLIHGAEQKMQEHETQEYRLFVRGLE